MKRYVVNAPLVNHIQGMVSCVHIVHPEPDRYGHQFSDLDVIENLK